MMEKKKQVPPGSPFGCSANCSARSAPRPCGKRHFPLSVFFRDVPAFFRDVLFFFFVFSGRTPFSACIPFFWTKFEPLTPRGSTRAIHFILATPICQPLFIVSIKNVFTERQKLRIYHGIFFEFHFFCAHIIFGVHTLRLVQV